MIQEAVITPEYLRNLMNLILSPKVYWPILKIFLNNRKTPIVPPLFYESTLVKDFTRKVELFNLFFAKRCTVINNDSSRLSSCLKQTRFCLM